MSAADLIPEDATVPTLSALLALRNRVQGRQPARLGRQGVSGVALSPFRGRGMEYAESREYVAGDDARHIDWRVSARTGRAHTKLFQADRDRLSLIVADTSPRLYFGSRLRFKSVQAARVAAVAAWAALQDGDRIAALCGSRQEAPIAPASGVRGVFRVLEALCRWYAAVPQDDEGLAFALDRASRSLRSGARLWVVAEPASVNAVPASRWAALAHRAEVVVLLMTDPFEQVPPKARLPFWQGDERQLLDLAGKAQRVRWQQHFVAPLQTAQALLAPLGVHVMALSCDADSAGWLTALRARRAG
ncbi:DUF58 domain-containing protein [Lysobacteraceae bacterium NML120232]|nr:DUF58 domain-containing protein [Xanthomonadaceae bacterium NML120232]